MAERREQRAHPRFETEGGTVDVDLRKEALVNLSQGGLLLLSRRLLPEGTRLRLRIELPKWKDLIACDGVVRWSAQSARDEDRFYAGLRFAEMDPLDVR